MRLINFYKTASGSAPVATFLEALNSDQAQKVAWVLQLVEEIEMPPKQYFK